MLVISSCDINSGKREMTSPRGQIQLIIGPMFSGKTTELIRRLKRYEIAAHKCLIIKYAGDVRYSETEIITHDRQSLSAVKATELMSLTCLVDDFTVLGIDEGQFFPDVAQFAEEIANQGKTVIVAALDATFQRSGFQNILELVPLAESVIKLTAVCMICFEEASYTKRKGSETELKAKDIDLAALWDVGENERIELIGGTDKYMAVCRTCYTKNPDDVEQKNH